MAPLKVIIFDLYNTLLYISKKDSPYTDILRIKPKKASATREYILTRYIPDTEKLFCSLQKIGLLPDDLKSEKREIFQNKLESELQSIKIFDDVLKVLEILKQREYKLGVISNIPTPYILPFQTLELDKFIDYSVFSSEEGYSKPSLEIYEKFYRLAIPDFKQLSFKDMLIVSNNLKSNIEVPKELGIKILNFNRQKNSQGDLSLKKLKRALE